MHPHFKCKVFDVSCAKTLHFIPAVLLSNPCVITFFYFSRRHYIHKEYTGVLKDSIVYYDKNELSLYEIKVQMNIPMSIELRQAIGYFLYMLQGMKLIHLEAKDTRKMEIRKVKFSQELLNMEDNLRGIIAKQEETEFARNVL